MKDIVTLITKHTSWFIILVLAVTLHFQDKSYTRYRLRVQQALTDYHQQVADAEAMANRTEYATAQQIREIEDNYERQVSDTNNELAALRARLHTATERVRRSQSELQRSSSASAAATKRADVAVARAESLEARLTDLGELLAEGDRQTERANSLAGSYQQCREMLLKFKSRATKSGTN